jgi:hypothetical protein
MYIYIYTYRKRLHEKHATARRASDDKGGPRQVDRHSRQCLFKEELAEGQLFKIQGRHPTTREGSDGKNGPRQVLRERRPCLFKKELAVGQLFKIQARHPITREGSDDKSKPRQVHRRRRPCLPKASLSKYNRSTRLQKKEQMTRVDPDKYTDRDDHAY